MPLATCQARSDALLVDDAFSLPTEGYLLKQGEGGLFSSAAYKKRYFRLENNILSYFSEKTSGKASGTIALDQVSDINLEESKGKVVLKLTTPNRVYTLSSEDEEILAQWSARLIKQADGGAATKQVKRRSGSIVVRRLSQAGTALRKQLSTKLSGFGGGGSSETVSPPGTVPAFEYTVVFEKGPLHMGKCFPCGLCFLCFSLSTFFFTHLVRSRAFSFSVRLGS